MHEVEVGGGSRDMIGDPFLFTSQLDNSPSLFFSNSFQKSKKNSLFVVCAEPGSAFFKSTLISLVNLIDALAGALLSDKYWDALPLPQPLYSETSILPYRESELSSTF